jgi:molybdate transport system regulatory protein
MAHADAGAVYTTSSGGYRQTTQQAVQIAMSQPDRAELKPVLRIDFPRQDRLGRGKIELLERIRDTGSISAAGRAMDMSYRRAWLLISDLNRMFSTPVVDAQRGGPKGGGAVLTAFGEELVGRFRGMEASVSRAIAADLDWIEANRSEPGQRTDNEG